MPSQLHGDAERIQQVLTNLLENSILNATLDKKINVVASYNPQQKALHIKVQNVCFKKVNGEFDKMFEIRSDPG